MSDPFQLVTNCNFKGKDYLVQMCVSNCKKLELVVTDKIMAEDWQCEYDASYIEALTHKTGNFKQFDVFVMMLKSGLLKTSDCITLDLFTLEDLEQLRSKKVVSSHSSSRASHFGRLNKRYLILTYSVEFDRIHYPLPLDYCGPPDPIILQTHIRKLESEISRLKQKNNYLNRADTEDAKKLKDKIQILTDDNNFLTNEIRRLNKLLTSKSLRNKNNIILQNSLKKLEEQVIFEKNHNQQAILKLKVENKQLKQQIEELKKSEKCLKSQLREASRYSQRGCKKTLQAPKSPVNYLDRKKAQRLENSCRPVASWNSSPVANRSHGLKTLKKSRNRFLTSSSSESEVTHHLSRSREKKQFLYPKQNLSLNRKESSRGSSNERSRHSSAGSKKNFQIEKPGLKRTSSHEGPRTRESSLSSRGSSKHTKISRLSNRGSGDCNSKSKLTSRTVLEDKEDLRFSVSDLETRIHALQKLLSESLNF